MLNLLEHWTGQEENEPLRYVMALLLIRKKVLKHEETEILPSGREALVVYCPRRGTNYHVFAVELADEAIAALQKTIFDLLFQSGEHSDPAPLAQSDRTSN
jgi:hypothetical protein